MLGTTATPCSYEGLIDELLGIEAGRLELATERRQKIFTIPIPEEFHLIYMLDQLPSAEVIVAD